VAPVAPAAPTIDTPDTGHAPDAFGPKMVLAAVSM
jgi:hypothetical protein